MNLADMLSYADIHQLHRIADHYACNCSTNSKNELIQSILNRINRKEVFETYVESLTLEDIRFLNSLLYDQRESFSLEELLARAQLSRFDAANRGPGGESNEAAHGIRTNDNPATVMLSAGTSRTTERPDANSSGSSKTGKKRKPNPKASKSLKESKEAPKEWSPRDMIARLKYQGWLFNGYSHQTKYLYQVPNDLKRRFGESLARSFERRLQVMEEPPVYRDEQRLLSDDIYQFLKYVYHTPVDLTSDGTMYKRSQQAIMDMFAVKEELVGKGGWRFGYGRKINEYPNRFSLIYDYCYYNGLIAEGPARLSLTETGSQRVASGKREDPAVVYKFWLRLYKNPIHNVQSLVNWIDRLAQRWVTVATLNGVLVGLVKPFYYDSPQSILEHRILTMMMHLGLLRLGEHPESGPVVEMTKLGSSIIRGVYIPDEDKVDLPDQRGSG
ncbi:hypothetical protein [Paenibacillus alkalitolerans]|uniref:hypothetical protein n=1 Tax=Paenibacillus alkalitolerans TaxID=2799335 RepID=UPI0018F72D7C|nr:hypothetical protein [Paenibacillus alkalitolerans]